MIFTLIIIIFIISLIAPVLFQEGNPLPLISGIVRLTMGNDDVVRISTDPERYMTKAENGIASMVGMMNEEGWQLAEQLGSGYIFQKNDRSVTITSRQYTRKYLVWKFPV